jgi:hypothetical protein
MHYDLLTGSSRLVSPELKARSERLYAVARDRSSITCLVCGFVSHDPQHVQAKFCPQCQVFHEDLVLMRRLEQGYQEEFQSASHTERLIRIAA